MPSENEYIKCPICEDHYPKDQIHDWRNCHQMACIFGKRGFCNAPSTRSIEGTCQHGVVTSQKPGGGWVRELTHPSGGRIRVHLE